MELHECGDHYLYTFQQSYGIKSMGIIFKEIVINSIIENNIDWTNDCIIQLVNFSVRNSKEERTWLGILKKTKNSSWIDNKWHDLFSNSSNIELLIMKQVIMNSSQIKQIQHFSIIYNIQWLDFLLRDSFRSIDSIMLECY